VISRGQVCEPCASKGVERDAVEDAPLWAGGPWAFLCEPCAIRARSHRQRWAEATVKNAPIRGAA